MTERSDAIFRVRAILAPVTFESEADPARTIRVDKVYVEGVVDLGEVVSAVYGDRPSWAEVSISEVMHDRDELQRLVALQSEINGALGATVVSLAEQRDSARDLAARLEAELARMTEGGI